MTPRQKARKELLALAAEWKTNQKLCAFECGDALLAAVDRLFPEKVTTPPAPTGPAVCVFKLVGGGEYGVTEDVLKELAARYELPETFLLKELEIVASKITAGVVTKKTERGMSRALYSWSEVARRKWERRERENPRPVESLPPAKRNGVAPRLVRLADGEAYLVDQILYRESEWPANRGPWPGGAP